MAFELVDQGQPDRNSPARPLVCRQTLAYLDLPAFQCLVRARRIIRPAKKRDGFGSVPSSRYQHLLEIVLRDQRFGKDYDPAALRRTLSYDSHDFA